MPTLDEIIAEKLKAVPEDESLDGVIARKLGLNSAPPNTDSGPPTPLGSFTRSVIRGAPSAAVAGTVGRLGLAGGAALAPFVGPVAGPAIGITTGLGGAAYSGYKTREKQDELMGKYFPSYNESMRRDVEVNPRASRFGDFLSQIASGFLPSPGNVVKAGKTAGSLITGGKVLQPEVQNLANVGIGAVTGPAMLAGQSAITGSSPTRGDYLQSSLGGMLFNKDILQRPKLPIVPPPIPRQPLRLPLNTESGIQELNRPGNIELTPEQLASRANARLQPKVDIEKVGEEVKRREVPSLRLPASKSLTEDVQLPFKAEPTARPVILPKPTVQLDPKIVGAGPQVETLESNYPFPRPLKTAQEIALERQGIQIPTEVQNQQARQQAIIQRNIELRKQQMEQDALREQILGERIPIRNPLGGVNLNKAPSVPTTPKPEIINTDLRQLEKILRSGKGLTETPGVNKLGSDIPPGDEPLPPLGSKGPPTKPVKPIQPGGKGDITKKVSKLDEVINQKLGLTPKVEDIIPSLAKPIEQSKIVSTEQSIKENAPQESSIKGSSGLQYPRTDEQLQGEGINREQSSSKQEESIKTSSGDIVSNKKGEVIPEEGITEAPLMSTKEYSTKMLKMYQDALRNTDPSNTKDIKYFKEQIARHTENLKSSENIGGEKTKLDEAIENIKRKTSGGQMLAGIPDPTIIKDLAVVGGEFIRKYGIKSFRPWSQVMKEKYGDSVEPHLKSVWDEIKHNRRVEDSSESLPYGYWITPEGEFIKVQNEAQHDVTGGPLLEKHGIPFTKDMILPSNPDKSVTSILTKKGYYRAVFGTSTLYIDSAKELTPIARRNLKDFGIENDVNINFQGPTKYIDRIYTRETKTSKPEVESDTGRDDIIKGVLEQPKIEDEMYAGIPNPQHLIKAGKAIGKYAGKAIGYFQPQIDKVKEKSPTGKYLAEEVLEPFYFKQDKLRGLGEDFVREASGYSKEQRSRVEQHLQEMMDTGKSNVTLTTEEQPLYQKYKSLIQDPTYTQSGIRSLKVDPNYYPQKIKSHVVDKILNDPTSPESKQLKQDFIQYQINQNTNQKMTPAQKKAQAESRYLDIVTSYKSPEVVNRASQFGPLDKPEGYGVPLSWRERDLIKNVKSYTDRAAKRIAYHQTVQSNPIAREALGIKTDPLGNPSPTGNILPSGDPVFPMAGDKHLAPIMKNIEGRYSPTEASLASLQRLTRAGLLGTKTGLGNLIGAQFQGWQHMKLGQTPGALAAGWKKLNQSLIESTKAGVNRVNYAQLIDPLSEGVFEHLNEFSNVINKVQAKNLFERISRANNWGQGKFLALAEHNRENRLSGKSKFLDDFGPKDWRKKSSLTPEEINDIASRYVNSVQGTYDYRGLPEVVVDSPYTFVTALSKWSVEKANNYNKYVVKPLMEGDPKPFLMQTAGMVLGGAAVEKVMEELSGRKNSAPSYAELKAGMEDDKVSAKDETSAIGYKMMSLGSLAGTAGIMSNLAKGMYDIQFGNRPQGINDPLWEAASRSIVTLSQAKDAFVDGEVDVGLNLITELLKDNIQTARLVMENYSQEMKKNVEHGNKMRDLRVYEKMHGLGSTDGSISTANPFVGKDIKEFRKSEDLGEIVDKGSLLINKALESNDPAKIIKDLNKLKTSSPNIMPSEEGNLPEFVDYYNWIVKTQGEEKASKLLEEYMVKTKGYDKARGKMVPSIR